MGHQGRGKTQPRQHTRGVGFYPLLEGIPQLRKRLDLLQVTAGLAGRGALQHRRQHGVVATGQVGAKTQADGQQRRALARMLAHAAAGGRENARHQSQHGGLAHPVAADNAQGLALADLQGYPVQDVVRTVIEGLAPRLVTQAHLVQFQHHPPAVCSDHDRAFRARYWLFLRMTTTISSSRATAPQPTPSRCIQAGGVWNINTCR